MQNVKRGFLFVSVVAAILTLAGSALAADLQWEYSTADEAKITGFRILSTDVNLGKTYSASFPDPALRTVKDITTTLHLIPSHEYKFTARAYNLAGESPDSNEVSWAVPPWKPPVDSHPVKIEIPAPASILIFKP
jgi:hypothetical protein